MNEIDEFLRENKPAVKDDPTFLLETRRRLEAVEGIKAEVDRQRSRGRLALVFALAIGLAVGVLATAIAFLYPVDAGSAGHGLWDSIGLFLATWKHDGGNVGCGSQEPCGNVPPVFLHACP